MVDFKDENNKCEFLCYKDIQINKLDTLLVEWAEISKKYKKSVLITYWLNDYENFLRKEDEFRDQRNYFKYKRGQVIFANFGYRIGSELGGNHYAVVLNKNDSSKSNIITVIPLTSKNPDKLHHTEVNLHNSMKKSMITKLLKKQKENSDLLEKIKVTINAVKYYLSSIDTATSSEDISNIDLDFCEFLRNEFVNDTEMINLIDLFELNHNQKSYETAFNCLTKIKSELNKYISELEKRSLSLDRDLDFTNKLKNNSIASISQITTISKLRIINPIRSNDTLANVKIETEYLDLINKKLKKLYIY